MFCRMGKKIFLKKFSQCLAENMHFFILVSSILKVILHFQWWFSTFGFIFRTEAFDIKLNSEITNWNKFQEQLAEVLWPGIKLCVRFNHLISKPKDTYSKKI